MEKKEWLIRILNGEKGTSKQSNSFKSHIFYDGFDFRSVPSNCKVAIETHTSDFAILQEPQFTYPMWFKGKDGTVVKFLSSRKGVIVSSLRYSITGRQEDWVTHKNSDVWTQVPEPKPTVKVAKYRFFNSVRYIDTQAFYVDDIDFKKDCNYDEISNITRLLETEIEVEDY